MEYPVDASEQRWEIGMKQILFEKTKVFVGTKPLQVVFFEGAWVIVDEGIDAIHLMAVRQQTFGEM
jgi:hypothetical protein